MSETREQKCRVIAEWLGWHNIHLAHSNGIVVGIPPEPPSIDMFKRIPDFYTDEAASAMVLEKMVLVSLFNQINVGWRVILADGTVIDNRDRKTAIADAAYAYAMQWSQTKESK
jgi:hypothetical protein